MTLTQVVIQCLRQGRARLMPVKNVPGHLSYLTRITTRQMGFQPEAVQGLERGVLDTCKSTGLDPLAK